MPINTLFTLGASQVSVSGGGSLSGVTGGDGSNLNGRTITLNSNAWQTLDINDDDPGFADNDSSQKLAGAQTFDGVAYTSGRVVEAEYRFTVQAPDGSTYEIIGLNIREPGAANPYGTIEGLAFVGGVGGFPPVGVPLTVISTGEGPAGAATPYATYATPPCFTAGTLIATTRGEVAVEDIAVGDGVATMDHGVQTVVWTGCCEIGWRDLVKRAQLRPVCIAKGALGPDQPARDMRVSPMHRLIIGNGHTEFLFGLDEVLVAAAHMVGRPGFTIDTMLETVTYYHIASPSTRLCKATGSGQRAFCPVPSW